MEKENAPTPEDERAGDQNNAQKKSDFRHESKDEKEGPFDPKLSLFNPLVEYGNNKCVPIDDVALSTLIAGIKAGEHQKPIRALRSLTAKTPERLEELQKQAKKRLKSVTASGVFQRGKSIKGEEPKPHSGLVQFDLDGIEDPPSLRDRLKSDPHAAAAFVSPRGNGVKVFVRIVPEQHRDAFRELQATYRSMYEESFLPLPDGKPNVDNTGNPNRLCFVSDDPDAWVNHNAVPYEVTGLNSENRKEKASVPRSGPVGKGPKSPRHSPFEVERALACIVKKYSRADYDMWTRITNAVCSAIGREDGIELLQRYWPEEEENEYEAKSDFTEITEGTLFHHARECGWVPEIYYDNERNKYLVRDGEGEFRAYTERHVKGQLNEYGFREVADSVLAEVRHNDAIDLHMNISGYRQGLARIDGKKVLVPQGARFIEPVKGDWPMLREYWEAIFGREQCEYFIYWLAGALQSYYAYSWNQKQVLALIGEPNSGKTLTQFILTKLFGDSQASPMQYILGKTDFNGDFASSTHLAIEDEVGGTGSRDREAIKERIKAFAVNPSHRIHPKGKQAFQASPFWVVTISVNPEKASLSALPAWDESVKDKLSLLWTEPAQTPMPASTAADKAAFREALAKEYPALIYDLLKLTEAPSHLREEEGRERMFVCAYHHPKALEQVEKLTWKGELLEAITTAVTDSMVDGRYSGTALEIHGRMMDEAGSSFERQTVRSLGRNLAAFARSHSSRVRLAKESAAHGHTWEIIHPYADLL